jgi:hypothetical protein
MDEAMQVLTGTTSDAQPTLVVRERLGGLLDHDRSGDFELVRTLAVHLG